MLGALLLVGEQLCGDAAVLLGVGPARAGAGDRLGGDVPAGDGEQRLGARAGDLEVAEVQEVHVGAGVDRAQAAVDREGVDRHGGRPALGGDDLEGVAGVDVADDPLDHRFELLAAACWTGRSGISRGPRRLRRGAPARRAARAPRRSSGRRPRRRARCRAPASRSALARIVTVCLRWSKMTSASESISAMSGSPSGSGLGSPRGSTVRTRS